MAVLKNTPKAASEPLAKLLKSAITNAENNYGMNTDNLYVAQCYVGPADSQENYAQSTGKSVQNKQRELLMLQLY